MLGALALFVALVGGCTALRSGDEDDGTGGPGGDGKGGRLGGQCKSGNDLSVLKAATCANVPG